MRMADVANALQSGGKRNVSFFLSDLSSVFLCFLFCCLLCLSSYSQHLDIPFHIGLALFSFFSSFAVPSILSVPLSLGYATLSRNRGRSRRRRRRRREAGKAGKKKKNHATTENATYTNFQDKTGSLSFSFPKSSSDIKILSLLTLPAVEQREPVPRKRSKKDKRIK